MIQPTPTPNAVTSSSISKFQGTMLILLLCTALTLLGWYIFEVSAGFDDRLQTGIARIDAISNSLSEDALQ